jgi:hypothetical protein
VEQPFERIADLGELSRQAQGGFGWDRYVGKHSAISNDAALDHRATEVRRDRNHKLFLRRSSVNMNRELT